MKIVGKKDVKLDTSFAEEVRERSGENVFLCYQCKKCASGCPSRVFMDSTPAELMRYVQLGMVDEAMKEIKRALRRRHDIRPCRECASGRGSAGAVCSGLQALAPGSP